MQLCCADHTEIIVHFTLRGLPASMHKCKVCEKTMVISVQGYSLVYAGDTRKQGQYFQAFMSEHKLGAQ